MHLKTYLTLLALALLTTLGTTLGTPAARAQAQQAGTCARVTIQLSQSVAITRTAFKATLTIGNSPTNVPLQNLKVVLDIRDANSNPANALFGISDPVLTGISDVNGTGTIAPGAQASSAWTLLPTRDAAPNGKTQYTVGGTIAYTLAGVNLTLPLFPAPITVMPDPLLQFHYFLQKQVYGDDPFTPQVEPSEPFALGLLVVNKGLGTAHNMTITSSQPQIVDNEKGLQIAFQLLGASVNGLPVSPSLTADLGDIGPDSTATADFSLLSSLQGTFLSFSATFVHKDDLNNPRTSIIDSVDTHFLEHIVRIVDPADDGKPDFLYYSTDPLSTDLDPVPDTVWSSNGTTAPTTPLLTSSSDSLVSNANLTVHLTVPATPATGFVYIRADDPGQNLYSLTGVVRSDGKVIRLGDNAWTTHRIIRLKGQNPFPQNRLYIFDDNSTGSYTLTYGSIPPIAPLVTVTSPHDGDTFAPNSTVNIAATATSIQASIAELDFYDGSSLVGSTTTSPFTVPYLPATGPHTLLAVATDANGTKGTSAPVTITVNSAVTPPPTVTLTGPVQNTELFAPATVTVSATATETGGTIAKVDFYNNGAFLGSASAAPFTLPLTNLPAGSYALTATATDMVGKSTTTSPLDLLIEPPLSATGKALLRVIAAVRQATPGQVMVTVQNSGGMNAVNIALNTAHSKWGTGVPTSILPATVPILAPNSTTTFMVQFPANSTSTMLSLSGSYSGAGFSSITRVTQ